MPRHITPEKICKEMHDFAMRNRHFSDGSISEFDIHLSETIDFREFALRVLKGFSKHKNSDIELGETIDSEEALMSVEYRFNARRTTDEGSSLFTFNGATATTLTDIELPKEIAYGLDPDDPEDSAYGSQKISFYYNFTLDDYDGDVSWDYAEERLLLDEDDDIVHHTSGDYGISQDPQYSRIRMGEYDDDNPLYGQAVQYIDDATRQRMFHEPLPMKTAGELAEILLLPDSLHDYEMTNFTDLQNLQIAAFSFRSLKRLLRQQSGL